MLELLQSVNKQQDPMEVFLSMLALALAMKAADHLIGKFTI